MLCFTFLWLLSSADSSYIYRVYTYTCTCSCKSANCSVYMYMYYIHDQATVHAEALLLSLTTELLLYMYVATSLSSKVIPELRSTLDNHSSIGLWKQSCHCCTATKPIHQSYVHVQCECLCIVYVCKNTVSRLLEQQRVASWTKEVCVLQVTKWKHMYYFSYR